MTDQLEDIFFIEDDETSIEKETWKILIVDDEKGIHAATKIALSEFSFNKKGLSFISAYSGEEAKKILAMDNDIALIFLDVVMETEDAGLLVVQYIRDVLKNHVVRIVLRTGQPGQAPEEETILKYDINDYKNKTELTSQNLFTVTVSSLRSYGHLIELQKHQQHLEELVDERTVELRKALYEIASRNNELEEDQIFAQKVFANIMDKGALDVDNIKCLISPFSVFNGDFLFAGKNSRHGQYVMLGDFTGHGLRAALGAIPVADIFYSMISNYYSIGDIIFEINKKLNEILPTGVFLCACIIMIDNNRKKLQVWNGGLPDLIIYSGDNAGITRVGTFHPPLGVLSSTQFDKTVKVLDIIPKDRIYIYSDGIVETRNNKEELFDDEGLERCFLNNNDPEMMFDEILEAVKKFKSGRPHDDDLTMIEILLQSSYAEEVKNNVLEEQESGNKLKWKIIIELNASMLKADDPLPFLIELLSKRPEYKENQTDIMMLISELLSNSLEHGVLGLDSAIKNKPDGFVLFLDQRKKALDELENGWIHVQLEHVPTEKGGEFIFKFEDSGDGFDHQKAIPANSQTDLSIFSGRGISIIKDMCKRVSYYGNGSIVEVVYAWE